MPRRSCCSVLRACIICAISWRPSTRRASRCTEHGHGGTHLLATGPAIGVADRARAGDARSSARPARRAHRRRARSASGACGRWRSPRCWLIYGSQELLEGAARTRARGRSRGALRGRRLGRVAARRGCSAVSSRSRFASPAPPRPSSSIRTSADRAAARRAGLHARADRGGPPAAHAASRSTERDAGLRSWPDPPARFASATHQPRPHRFFDGGLLSLPLRNPRRRWRCCWSPPVSGSPRVAVGTNQSPRPKSSCRRRRPRRLRPRRAR